MTSNFYRSEPLQGTLLAQVAEHSAQMKANDTPLALLVVQIGANPASNVYVNIKKKKAESCGVPCAIERLPESISQRELNHFLQTQGANPHITGILLQLPLPAHLSAHEALAQIPAEKDVDGLGLLSAGLLEIDAPEALHPATPLGVMRILAHSGTHLEGANVVIIGRSHLVGRPLANMLIQQGATVTVCNSKTKNLSAHTQQADILICATGTPALVQPKMIKAGAVLVDVGITPHEENGQRTIRGDIAPECAEKAKLQTAVPGGVGPMTVASLLTNTIDAAAMQAGQTRKHWRI